MPACPGGRVSGLARINDPAQVYVEVIHRTLPVCKGDAWLGLGFRVRARVKG